MQTLPSMLGFLFSNTLISSLMIFTLPVQFSSTREAHLSQAKYTPRILSLLFHTNPQKVSVQFCLLPSHISSDFIRCISWERPENVENSAKSSSACSISYPAHLLKTTLHRLHIVQFLWYFPFMFSRCHILIASSSTARRKASGEKGQPWRIPTSTAKYSDNQPQ